MPVLRGPFKHQCQRPSRQFPARDPELSNIDDRLVLAVRGVEVRRTMFSPEHLHDDAIERAPEREFASSGIPDLEIFWVVDEATNQERTGGLPSNSGDPERFTNARRLLRQQSRRPVPG
jgi:hypothetical protein